MNILNRISIRNLKLNKKRTISTIIGIILSVALICAVSAMGNSFQETLIQNAVNEKGYWHIQLNDVKDEKIKDIENNRDVKSTFQIKECGYAKINNKANIKNKKFVKIFSMNQESFNNLKLEIIKGNFPKNKNEILISESINSEAKLNYKIGDTVEFDIGERKITKNTNEEIEEKIINEEKHTFKIVGILSKPIDVLDEDDSYTIISTGIDEGKNDIYISLKNPKEYKKSISEMLEVSDYNVAEEHDTNKIKYDYNINNELLRWEVFAFSDSTISMLYSVIGVVIFIIIFTSVFCIRNSFAIATTEKIKMYSMLASVGATKKQIRKNVITEGMLLGIIGIPLGIISGFFAVYVLIKIVNMLLGDSLFSNVNGLIFKVSLIPILISIVLGIVTIYLSSRSSARKASKVSPIEGLRGSNDIKIKNKKLRVPKIISKVFKTGGELAYKNLKRSKKKYRTTVISIAVSIFIFITMNAFIANAFDLSLNYYEDFNYNYIVRTRDLSEEEINKIISLDNIDSYSILSEIDDENFKIKDLSKVNDFENEEDNYNEKTNYQVLSIVALDSKSFERYIKEIGAKYEEVKDKGVLCDEYKSYNKENDKMDVKRRYKYKKGDLIEGFYKEKEQKIKIGEISNIKPDGLKKVENPDGYLIVDKSQYGNLNFKDYEIVIQSGNCTQLENDIKKINSSAGTYNLEEASKNEKAMVLVIKIFLYGFITVITLIGVTNIFNTITSNMELRQREFAMLKSIGMTKKEFNRMINLETIFYGTKSWIYGTIMGLIGTFALYKAFSIKINKEAYIPINAIIISAIFVFIFVFIIMRYSIAKINKQNTIETIRNENI